MWSNYMCNELGLRLAFYSISILKNVIKLVIFPQGVRSEVLWSLQWSDWQDRELRPGGKRGAGSLSHPARENRQEEKRFRTRTSYQREVRKYLCFC